MDEQITTPRQFVLIAAVLEGGLAVLAVGVGWLLGLAPASQIGWTLSAASWGLLASMPLLGLLWACVWRPIGPLAEILRVIDELLVPLFRTCSIVELAVISALAGLGEELLFRGVIQQALDGWLGETYGLWGGLLGASILFGLAHAVTRAYAVWAALVGLYLGWLWLATGNLLVPMTTHAAYDFAALTYFVKIRRIKRGQNYFSKK